MLAMLVGDLALLPSTLTPFALWEVDVKRVGKHLMLSQPPQSTENDRWDASRTDDRRSHPVALAVANKAKPQTGRGRDMWPGAWTRLSNAQLETEAQKQS